MNDDNFLSHWEWYFGEYDPCDNEPENEEEEIDRNKCPRCFHGCNYCLMLEY